VWKLSQNFEQQYHTDLLVEGTIDVLADVQNPSKSSVVVATKLQQTTPLLHSGQPSIGTITTADFFFKSIDRGDPIIPLSRDASTLAHSLLV
jgi:hypothetical protein